MKKNFLRGLVLCLALLLAIPLAASASVVQPTEMFYVYDGANVLSEATEATIVYNNDTLFAACGAEIVFVTVPSTGSMDISDYAYKLFNDWGIGSAERNNGVLILLEIGEEEYWYLQGSGIETRLTTGDLAALVDTYLEPDFAVGDYDAGAAKLFEQLFARVANIYGVTAHYKTYSGFTERASAPAATAKPSTSSSGSTFTPQRREAKRSGFLGTILKWIVWFMIINFVLGLFKRRSYRRRGLPVAALGFFLFKPWRLFTRRASTATPPPASGPAPRGTGGTTTFSSARRAGWYAGAGSSVVKNIVRSSSSARKSSGGSSFSSSRSSFSSGGRSSGFGGGRSSGGFSRSGGGGVSRGGGGGRHR